MHIMNFNEFFIIKLMIYQNISQFLKFLLFPVQLIINFQIFILNKFYFLVYL